MLVRLQKFLADAGIASRRKAEELIVSGKISVNGEVVKQLGSKIDTKRDIVRYNGEIAKPKEKYVYIMLHKPEGYVTTAKDQFGRPIVLDLVGDIQERIVPVGRLDYETSGLLLLTNDGELVYKLTHPKHHIPKTYIAKIKGIPSQEELQKFRDGLVLEDGYKTKPAQIEIIQQRERYCSVKIIIGEGRNRQVRKMCQAIGHTVVELKRIATGELLLGQLKKGDYRFLTDEEIDYLKR